MSAVSDASNMTGATTGLVSQVYSGKNQERAIENGIKTSHDVRVNVAEAGNMFQTAFDAYMKADNPKDLQKYAFAMQMMGQRATSVEQTLGGSAAWGGGTTTYQGSPYGGAQLNQGPQNPYLSPTPQTQQTQKDPYANLLGGGPFSFSSPASNGTPQSYSAAANGAGSGAAYDPNTQQNSQQFRPVS